MWAGDWSHEDCHGQLGGDARHTCPPGYGDGGSVAFGGARTRWMERPAHERGGQGLPAGWDMDSDGQRATTCHNQQMSFIGGGLRSGVAIGRLSDVLTHPPPFLYYTESQQERLTPMNLSRLWLAATAVAAAVWRRAGSGAGPGRWSWPRRQRAARGRAWAGRGKVENEKVMSRNI
jgi:hypothetical protein